MKCIRNGSGQIRRVSDSEAEQLVCGYRIEKGKRVPAATGGWSYCPKSEWKNKKSTPAPEATPAPAPEEAPAPEKKAKKPRGKKAEKSAARKAEKAAVAVAEAAAVKAATEI